MSTSVLGESWVVASIHTEKEAAPSQAKEAPATPVRAPATEAKDNHGSPSMSGAELIMPSIYETPIAEESWIAPNVREKQTSPSLRRRPQTSSQPTRPQKTAEESTDSPKQGAHSTTTSADQTQTRFAHLEGPIRILANFILFAAISHLLILPELVQQYQSTCSIGAISALYPSSCISGYQHQPFNLYAKTQTAPIGAVSTQARLESLFNTTLHEMAPLTNSLKQTEFQLQSVERELRRIHPGTKHELNLEFESCWPAIRVAAWKFDSLKVDLQSAVDSLVAAGDVKAADSVAHDARLSTQMLRRENYINQLMARMRSKADSLAVDLATLDDHLESIESIVDRETKHSGSPHIQQLKDSSSRLGAFVDAVVPSFLHARDNRAESSDDASSPSPKLSLSQLFDEATAHHRPVANLARNLSKQLQQSPQNK
ncbi:hypothetical protein BDV18DRAFT_131654 [Aspergillus unguis]